MSEYKISTLAEACRGELHPADKTDFVIRNILIDSRKPVFPGESIFVAIKGERHDGHNYIEELYAKNVRSFIVSRLPDNISDLPDAIFILVPNTLTALQQVSAMHRSVFDIPVMGITGSNGKTILKEWLFQLLHKDKIIVRSPKSYNSQVGVPLSVWQLGPHHEIALFEAGISRPGEMGFLEPVIKPGIGIITNIGEAHQEYFTDMDEKLAEKLSLFKNSDIIIYCRDHKLIDDHLMSNPDFAGKKFFTWSSTVPADLQIKKISRKKDFTSMDAIYRGENCGISIPFTDRASAENAIHAWAVLLMLGYSHDYIAENMRELIPVAMRMEQKQGINNCTVINDSYNSDPGSLAIAMEFLARQVQHERKTIVLSDMFETGKGNDELYMEIGNLLGSHKIDRFIGIGDNIREVRRYYSGNSFYYRLTDDFISDFNPGSFNNEAILLKGSRKFGFERISLLLEEKAHATVLEINLNNLIMNFNYFRSRLEPGTGIMAVVKAFSYGSGSYEIANILSYNLVDYLAVAFFDEGLSLRKAGISLPVMVMNPDFSSYPLMADNLLEPEIYSFSGLRLFIEMAESKNLKRYPVHIKLDTGMHRLGFTSDELPELIKILVAGKAIEIKSLFSHLAAADDPSHDDFTREQIALFRVMSDNICKKLGYPVLRHILNSAGIERFPGAQFDMVRLGIGMYGISSLRNNRLANVNTFRSVISQVKDVPAGRTVGYARAHRTVFDTRVAIVPVGYADGLDRRLGNGRGMMIVNGFSVPVLGNICMDMCMLDITGTNAREGDEVIIFGDEVTISDIAKLLGTIPYEVFTNISGRVKRVYVQE